MCVQWSGAGRGDGVELWFVFREFRLWGFGGFVRWFSCGGLHVVAFSVCVVGLSIRVLLGMCIWCLVFLWWFRAVFVGGIVLGSVCGSLLGAVCFVCF